jgi:DNA polymerase-3 subunit delta'
MPAAATGRKGTTAQVRGFSAVLGHDRAIRLLSSQRAAGRLAHAYCFTGDEGIGKTSLARALAEEMLLGTGQPARLDVHPDFWIDDRSDAISIDEIRFQPEKGAQAHDQSLQQFLSLKPFSADSRLALIANAERMTEAAQNCLLKTLEEPPPHTVLVLTTAYPEHLLPTCLSRCQMIALSPINRSELASWLGERAGDSQQRETIAAFAQGRPGMAVRALKEPEWVERLTKWADELSSLVFADADQILSYALRFGQGPAAEQRLVAGEALRALTIRLKDAMLIQAGMEEWAALPASRWPEVEEWARRVSADHLRRCLLAAQRTQLLIDQNVNPRFAMEVLLLDLRLPQPV